MIATMNVYFLQNVKNFVKIFVFACENVKKSCKKRTKNIFFGEKKKILRMLALKNVTEINLVLFMFFPKK